MKANDGHFMSNGPQKLELRLHRDVFAAWLSCGVERVNDCDAHGYRRMVARMN
jgi:hypothetical protein